MQCSGIQSLYAPLTVEDIYICHRHGKGIKKTQQGLELS